MATEVRDATDQFGGALDAAYASIRRTIPRMGTDRPSIGEAGGLTYIRCGDNDWVDSFWCGQLWLAWDETKDEAFFAAARAQRPYFAARLDRPASHNHDLGFLYSLTTVADYLLTGDREARALSLRAADALAGRFNRAGNFIQAWNAPAGSTPEEVRRRKGKIIIDCMMNLGLLFWAARESGRDELAAIAIAHADTTTRYIIRPDGSTYHTYDFDPDTGAALGGFTAQGFADESCWSRGHAWAIHGYTRDLSAHRRGAVPRHRAGTRRLGARASPGRWCAPVGLSSAAGCAAISRQLGGGERGGGPAPAGADARRRSRRRALSRERRTAADRADRGLYDVRPARGGGSAAPRRVARRARSRRYDAAIRRLLLRGGAAAGARA